MQAGAVRDEGDVVSLAAHFCSLNVDRSSIGGQGALAVVERRPFKDEDGIGIVEGRGEHAAGVLEGGGGEHLQARDVGVPPFEAVRVLGSELVAPARRHADDDRHVELAAGHVQEGGGRVQDLVEGEQAEVDGHDFDDGPHPAQCGPNPGPHEGRLREGRVADAVRPELLQQPLADGKAAAVPPHVLAHQEDALVRLHRRAEGLPHGLAVGHLGRGGGVGAHEGEVDWGDGGRLAAADSTCCRKRSANRATCFQSVNSKSREVSVGRPLRLLICFMRKRLRKPYCV